MLYTASSLSRLVRTASPLAMNCCVRRWRTSVSMSLPSLTRWNALCRYRHSAFYVGLPVMPIILVSAQVREVFTESYRHNSAGFILKFPSF